MAEGRTLLNYRKVFEDAEFVVGVRFDCGKWTVESRSKANGRTSAAEFSAGAMDQIVAAWPQVKKDVR